MLVTSRFGEATLERVPGRLVWHFFQHNDGAREERRESTIEEVGGREKRVSREVHLLATGLADWRRVAAYM